MFNVLCLSGLLYRLMLMFVKILKKYRLVYIKDIHLSWWGSVDEKKDISAVKWRC